MLKSVAGFAISLTMIAVGSAGCASSSRRTELPPVGPTTSSRATFASNPYGLLEVHSATEANDDGGVLYQLPSSYTIHAPDGKRVMSVVNHVGPNDSSPMAVQLPAGSYHVFAQSMRYGQVKVPVVISANRLTQVYLDGTDWPNAQGVPDAELVRLPDGRVVGRKASPDSPSR